MFLPVLLWDILCAERWKTPMSERSWLEWKKDWCQEQVYDLNKKIRDARNARESLEAFLRSVQNKQSEHLEAIGRKQNSVDRVTGSCKNCKVADKYAKANQKNIGGASAKKVKAAYAGLLSQGRRKLQSYQNQIDDWSAQISGHRQRIWQINRALSVLDD